MEAEPGARVTLRTYAPMRRVSRRRQQGQKAWQAVYRQVDERSDGQCEAWIAGPTSTSGFGVAERCPKRAVEHHHLVKPRASNHVPSLVVHLCRGHHDRCEWPYERGRLCLRWVLAGHFVFEIVYVSEKRR